MKNYYLIFIVFIIDVISKQVIIHLIDLHQSIKIINNFFYLTYVRNKGAAFSIFEDMQSLILLITVIALFYLYKILKEDNLNKYESICYGLISGGVLGNLFDRLSYGYVIDFLDFRFGKYRYPIFNLADCFIVIGVLFLFIYMLKERGKYGIKRIFTKSKN